MRSAAKQQQPASARRRCRTCPERAHRPHPMPGQRASTALAPKLAQLPLTALAPMPAPPAPTALACNLLPDLPAPPPPR